MKKWRIFEKGEEKGKAVGNRLQTPEGTRERDSLRGAPECAWALQLSVPCTPQVRVRGAKTRLQVPGRSAL